MTLKNPLTIALLSSLAQAEIGFYCVSKLNGDFKAYGDIERYEGCKDLCQCYAFELLCLTRDEDVHTLESVSYKFAETCDIT